MNISRRDFNGTILASMVGAAMSGSASLYGAEETQQELARLPRGKGQKFKSGDALVPRLFEGAPKCLLPGLVPLLFSHWLIDYPRRQGAGPIASGSIDSPAAGPGLRVWPGVSLANSARPN